MIEFSLKRFLSFFDSFMPAALSRFGTLAEFGTAAEYSFGSLASSINIPLTMALTKVHSLGIANKNK